MIAESEELIKKLCRWKDGVEGKGMKVNMKLRLVKKTTTEYRILEDGHVVFVVEVQKLSTVF